MTGTPEQLYLDLMKQTLSFSLWPEPPVPVTSTLFDQNRMKIRLAAAASRFLERWGVQLVRSVPALDAGKEDGRVWPGYADTMIGRKRLDNLQECVETVVADKVDGDFIELGVWRGGACIFMRAMLAAYGVTDRRVFVADSFEGLPMPDTDKYPEDEGDVLYTHDYLAVSIENVRKNFERYGLLDDQVVFIKGFFEDSLQDAPVEKLSILRLDGDMYSSTTECLEQLYGKLSVGGFCIIDDYHLKGCRAAVGDFREKHGLRDEIKSIDWSGVYWRKERAI